MKKKISLILVLVLVLALVASFALTACGKKPEPTPGPEKQEKTSDQVYSETFGDYATLLDAAKAKTDVDERYVAMAIAEAKLLESGAFLPTTSQGGRYALNRIAYGTVSPVLWGLDDYRFHNALIATEFIKTEYRNEMKVKYNELKGTGTYAAWAKTYLEGKGYTLKDSYTRAYSSDPRTWDITNTYRAADSEAIVNTFDGLLEYDNENVQQPALAEALPTVSDDGLTYTFKIREGVYWVTQDGTKYAEVTAQDWVDGMKNILDKGMTSYLVDGIIKGASAYLNEETTDFGTVGVKATDKYTLVYTLEAPCSYFLSMFGYNPFAPVCQKYIDATEDYGSAPDKILYCGAYIVTNYTKDNKIVFSANPEYWNKDNITIKTINWLSYNGNSDTTATYKDAKAGTIDGCSLNTSTETLAKEDNLWDYVYVSGTDATTYGFFYNLNRKGYTTEGYDDTASKKTDAQKEATVAAMQKVNFRMAIARGLDRAAYNALQVGDDCKLYSLQNSYTPGSFVQLSKAVTTKINGKDTTFAAGTYYGAILQAQIDADMGSKAIKVWDPTLEGGAGSSAGFDGWYNADLAKEYLAAAIAELAADGITVDKDNPICLDYPVYGEDAIYLNRANAIKQAMNTLFEGKVQINIVSTSLYGWYYVGYYAESGAECNYDLYDCSGWGPDYGDPATYLNTMKPVDGDMIKMCGVY